MQTGDGELAAIKHNTDRIRHEGFVKRLPMANLPQVGPHVMALCHPADYPTDPKRSVHDDITTLPPSTAGIAEELRSHAEHRREDGLDHRSSIVGAPAHTPQWGLIATRPLLTSIPPEVTQWQQGPRSFANQKTGIACGHIQREGLVSPRPVP